MFLINLSNVIDILANSDCPYSGHSCFPEKAFAVFRGVQPATDRVQHVPFRGIRVFRKKLLPKSEHKMAQNGPNLHNYLCACPFLGLSYFEFK
jgi:hypothetical protein